MHCWYNILTWVTLFSLHFVPRLTILNENNITHLKMYKLWLPRIKMKYIEAGTNH
jgi:hypothetical protein